MNESRKYKHIEVDFKETPGRNKFAELYCQNCESLHAVKIASDTTPEQIRQLINSFESKHKDCD